MPLKDMKESYPVETAEYAVQAKISEQPVFKWWVHKVLKKRKAILSKVKSKYWQTTHKYGIKIPKSVKQALTFDRENGNDLWWTSICEEMKTVKVAFEEVDSIPVGYTHITCHLIFDVKLGENFRRKARLVAGGHKTGVPSSITYSSVVSRDSVRICLTLAALNGLDVLSCDIKGAYLTAPAKEKVVTTAGPEFGAELQGKTLKIVRALYGLKSAGAAFRSYLAQHLRSMHYLPSLADPDVWMRPAMKPDGFKYYEYILAYVDDLLCISHHPLDSLNGVRAKFTLKGDKIEPPDDYLGATLKLEETANGYPAWTQSAMKYVNASVANVEEKFGKFSPTARHFNAPFPPNYRPETDCSPELKEEGHRYYQELIGVLRWACELGRLDILLETSLLSTYLASPRQGHLDAAIHMFGYLKHHPKRKLAMDPEVPHFPGDTFKKYNWEEFYAGVEEAIPPNAPKPRGCEVSTTCFVDASLANDTVTRRSQMGILIFLNRAPIIWLSKRIITVETSTFGSEIVAMKYAVELIEALRYKLRMFGVPIDGPTSVFCDNQAVVTNCSTPESTLKKKHHSINYHRNREAVAAGIIQIAKEGTKTNLADVFTKVMGPLQKTTLIDKFMY